MGDTYTKHDMIIVPTIGIPTFHHVATSEPLGKHRVFAI